MAKAARAGSGSSSGEGAGSGRADREQRWDEIITASAEIFFEKGYEATSVQDIAEAVGILKGSIYYYIDTKEDILLAMVSRALDTFSSVLMPEDADLDRPATVRLHELIDRWITLSQRQREWGSVAEREFIRLSPGPMAEVMAKRKKMNDFVQDIVEQGMTEGVFDDGLDLGLATDQVFALLKSSHLMRRPRNGSGQADLADAYALFAMRGLGAVDWKPER